jgi:hypothetical protein
MTEDEIRDRWVKQYESLRLGSRNIPDPEIPDSLLPIQSNV